MAYEKGEIMGAIRWTTLSEVQSKPVQWLWEGRIPYGKVTILDGEPGSGKSLLAIDLAARVSRGTAMPLESAKSSSPANVVIYNDDDNLADTIRPRFEAVGAELSRIRCCVDGEITAPDVQELRPGLIIIDPLSSYLCLESNCPPRQVLKNIAQLARDTGAAVMAVQSLPKDGYWAPEVYDTARSVLFVSSIGHGRHRVAVTKSNLRAAGDVTPLVYQIQPAGNAVRISGWADSV
jgi:hypothetical protein